MSTKAVLIIAGTIIVVWLLVGLMPIFIYCDPTQRGTFGDMFGAVNALFSGMALAGVVYAILLQREELRLQRQELELTRTELHKTAKAQASSAATLGQQYKLAERNTKIQALTALLQSCNQRISHEQESMSQKPDMLRMIGGGSLGKLYKQSKELEKQLHELLETPNESKAGTESLS